MSTRRKSSASPLRQKFPRPDERGRSLGWSLEPDMAEGFVGYCVEWNTQTRRRRTLGGSKDLRAEILCEQHPGLSKLIVVHSVESHVLETLRGVGGLDVKFLKAHIRKKRFQPRGSVSGRWWHWEYPELRKQNSGKDDVSFFRVSLWIRGHLSFLLVNRPVALLPLRVPPRLRHQDAATRASALRTASRYGPVDDYSSSSKPEPLYLDSEAYELLDGGSPLEDIVGELVYSRWLAFFETLSPKSFREESTLWQALKALEQNQDLAQYLEKNHRILDTPSYTDWTDLINRIQRRLLIISKPPAATTNPPTKPPENDADKRSLDRIAYLGGLLLPVTVVSSILAIEGDYGPEGNNFWVFWVASVVMSAVVIVIIYLDQVRTLQVWMEVAVDAIIEGSDDEDDKVENAGDGVVVQRLQDGELVRAWRRKELGWGGAMKKVSGYYRWRRNPSVQFQAPRAEGR